MILRKLLAIAIVTVMTVTVFSAVSMTGRAEIGPVDSYGYCWVDSNSPYPTVPFDWIDISGTGTDTGIDGDDVYAGPFPIGFDFSYYGNTYAMFNASSNGFIMFDDTGYYFSNYEIPNVYSPNNLVAIYWDDLFVSHALNLASIRYETIGLAPERQLVVEFENICELGSSDLMTFEMILNETGEIWFQYGAMNGNTAASATVGIENEYGTIGSEYSCFSESLSDDLAIRFACTAFSIGPEQESVGVPGDYVEYLLTVRNDGLTTDSYDITCLSSQGWIVEHFDAALDPLGDDNLNGIPDTGDIAPGSSADIIIRVNVPLAPASVEDFTTVFATSYYNPSIVAAVSLITKALEAVFVPPYSDFVNDTDSDGLFNLLSFNVSLEVYVPGTYAVYAMLSISPYGYVASAKAWAELDVGPQILRPSLDARIINSYETDGPYTIEFVLYSSVTGNLSTDSYITSAYSWTQFDPPEIRFNTPFADYGRDGNGDTLYDSLVLEATVDVALEGDYEVFASLWDVYGENVNTMYNDTHLTVGTHVIEFSFDGSDIWYGYHDGPFEAYMYAYDDMMIQLDHYEYTTASYTYDEFQLPLILAPPYSDYGLDDNSNGLFDYLVVEVPVVVFQGGIYLFDATLSDYEMTYVDSDSEYIWLDIGSQVVEFQFEGEVLRENAVDGNYTVDFTFLADSYRILDSDSYETGWYGYDEFEGSASIVPPHTEYTIDADGDGLYDSLVLSLDLEIYVAGYYYLYTYLYDDYGTYIIHDLDVAYYTVGSASVDAIFPGWIFENGGYDGPYEVYAELLNEYYAIVDEYGSFTESYAYDDFEEPSELTLPYSEYGYDANGDGFYDYLIIEVTVNITSAAEYSIDGWLSDEWGTLISISRNDTYLEAGVQTLELYCLGQPIHDSGLNGPYTVELSFGYTDWGWVDYDTFVTGYYTYDEFQPKSSYFSTSFWDYPVDATGDGLYEYLVVVATLNVTVPGEYTVTAPMFDPYGYLIQWADNTSYFEAGIQEIELWFYGPAIRASERDGYYCIYLNLYDIDMEHLDDYLYYSSNYMWSEFQSAAAFSHPHSDYGYDEDEDSIYEYLVIDVVVEVFMSDEFTVQAYIFDDYWNYIVDVETTQYCEEGLAVISIRVPGWEILENHVDGPYHADLYLYCDGDIIDSDYYTTSYYPFNGFSQIPAQFGAPHSDHGYDDDGDLLYEYLVVEVRVNVTLEGTYLLQAELGSYTFLSFDSVLVEATLSEGMQTIEVMFDCWTLAGYDSDGPYKVELSLFMDDSTFLDYEEYETGSYTASEFDPAVPMIYSYWTSEGPTIDGIYSAGEWNDADCVSFVSIDPLTGLDLIMHVLNNGTHLFVCYDFIGDLTEDVNDGAIVCLDTGNDGILTPDHEDRFIIRGDGTQVHETYDYSNYSSWSTHCSPFDQLLPHHEGLSAAAGFGSSDQLAADHRVYELCIPLDLIEASSNDILGVAGAALDYSTYEYCYWPLIDEMLSTPSLYGDLVLYSSAPPATTVALSGTEGSNGWYTSAVEFTLTSEDDDEGVNCTRYRLDGGAWSDYTSPVTVSAEGSHTLEFYSTDLVGNQERLQEASINIDLTAPEATATSHGTIGEDDWYISEVSISLQGDDGAIGSGIADFTVRIDGGSWVDYASSLSISEDGVFLLEYYCTDVAGMSSDIQELTVKVDATAPETTASVAGSIVTLSATDPTSGVYLTKYRIDGGDWLNYTVPFEVPGSGNRTVEYYSIDNAGNAGDISLQLLDNGSGGTTVFGIDLWTLIMVLLVMAILIGIAIPKIFGMRRKAKEADTKAIIKDMATAVAQLVDDNPQSFPPKGPGLELPTDEEKPPKND